MALKQYNFTHAQGGGIAANSSGYYNVSYMVLPTAAAIDQVDYRESPDYYQSVLGSGAALPILNDLRNNFSNISPSLSAAIDIITGVNSVDPYSVYFDDVSKVSFEKKIFGAPGTDAAIVLGAKVQVNGDITFAPGAYAVSLDHRFGPEIYGDIWFNASITSWNNVVSGTNDFVTAMHEIAHSLGLAHASTNTSLKYTIMGDGFISHPDMPSVNPTGLQLNDILDIQSIYGREYSTRSDNTIYGLGKGLGSVVTPFIYTIWDGAGTDVIDASDYTNAALIDLRQGNFSSIGKNVAGGAALNNVAMAYYAVIENAIGTSYDDLLIGNAWNNILFGGSGKDTIFGDGVTTADKNAGFKNDDNDRPGASAAANDSGNDILLGGVGDDTMYGGVGNDILHGGYRQSDINVGWGSAAWDSAGQFTGVNNSSGTAITDIAYAIDGRDTANYSRLSTGVGIVAEFLGHQNTVIKGTFGAQGTDQLYSIEYLVGSSSDDHVKVNITQGGKLSGFHGGEGYNALDFIGGVRNGADSSKHYDNAGNLVYDALNTNNFSDIDSVMITEAAFLMHDVPYVAYLGYISRAIYSLYVEGISVDMRQTLSSFQSSGIWYGSETFGADADIDNSGTTTHYYSDLGGVTGTDYNDTFTLSSSGSGIGYNGSARLVQIAGGKGDDTVSVGSLTVHMKAEITYHSGNDVYNIQGAEDVTVYFDDEVLVSQVTVSSTTYDVDNKLTQVVFQIGSDTLTLNGPDLRGLDVEFHSGGWVELDDEVTIHGATSSSRDVVLDWGDDVYSSSSADETQTIEIFGLAGNDTLNSGLGSDTFHGGAGSDTVVRNAVGGSVHFDGGDGAIGDVDILDYRGIANPIDYIIDGDKITTVLGTDTFTNIERVFLSEGGGSVTILNASSAAISLGTGGNTSYGSSGSDTIHANSGNDTIYGGAGDDSLDATFGADKVYGEAGNDKITVFAGNHTADGGDGDDIIILQDFFTGYHSTLIGGDGFDMLDLTDTGASSITLSGNTVTTLEFGSYTIDGFEAVRGSYANNVIRGDDYKSYHLYGGAGNDIIYAGDMGDHLYGDAGNDLLIGGAGDDTLYGGEGQDTLAGESGNDTYVYHGVGIVDTVSDTGGNDRILFGGDLDIADMLLSYDGTTMHVMFNWTIQLAILNATDSGAIERIDFEGGSSYDVLNETYTLRGTDDGETMNGLGWQSTLYGFGGDDILDMQSSYGVLNGGDGNDTLRGGDGWDLYLFSEGNDVIEENPSIFSTYDILVFTDGYQSQYLSYYRIVDEDLSGHDDLIIDDGLGNTVTIKGQYSLTPTAIEELRFALNEWSIETGGVGIIYTEFLSVQSLVVTTYGSENDNEIHGLQSGASANDRIYAFDGNDTVWGYNGNDEISGGAGDDILYGGLGDDIYVFTNGDGNDLISDASGTDIIRFDETVNSVSALYTRSGDDLVISYGTGANTVTVSGFFDVSNTGQRIEKVVFDVDQTEHTADDIIGFLGGIIEDLTLTGTAGVDTLTGGVGNDTLDGLAGADILVGGAGDDTYVVDDAGDAVVESINEGQDIVLSSVSYTLAHDVEDLTLTVTDHINAIGNDLANIITGNVGNNTLDGAAGIDTLAGGFGDDFYVVDNTSDVVLENLAEGVDVIQSSVTYSLSANVENLMLSGASNIHATGNGLNNTLIGNTGANTLNGGLGVDTMIGGNGADTYIVDDVGDVVAEAASQGIDTIHASVSYTLAEHVENLLLTGAGHINATGNDLDNVITGNDGDNQLFGNDGNDTLSGGLGVDTMAGGAGNDLYVIDNAVDIVTEISSEGVDTVQASIDYELSANVENLMLTGALHIDASGNELSNILVGNNGNNTLDGGAGADTMTGGTGNDTYVVDDPGDVVIENTSEGTDTVRASINYTLGANVENLVLTGSANINGSGNAGNNTLVGNSGNNTLSGGLGDDTYVFTSAGGNDVVSEAGGTDTIRFDATVDAQSIVYTRTGDDLVIAHGAGTDTVTVLGFFDENSTNGHIETVVFDEDETFDTYNDIVAAVGAPEAGLTLTGTAGVDTLVGGAGNDTLNGLAGADTLIGAAGNDLYIVDNAGDVVIESAGQGTDTVQSSVTYTLSANVENLTLTGTVAIHGTGNALSNVITGNSGNNSLNGGAGADTLIGGAGNDTYIVDNTEDVVIESLSEGSTDIVLASVSYTLSANVERLTLTGTDHINGTGNALVNTLIGNSGNNTLDSGAGADRMEGGTGNDVYIVDNASDTVVENASAGTDVVYASVGYTLANNVENLILTGAGDINGTGNSLANTLVGNSGNNTLSGGAGVDTMMGGAGNDVYIVEQIDDVVIENDGEGIDTVRSYISHTLGAHVENLTLFSTTANLVATGNSLDNTLLGSSAVNTLIGAGGDDYLDGGAGVDTLVGGTGNDTYVVDNVNDIVIEEAGEGIDTVRASVNYTLSANVENLILTGTTVLHATGNALDNTLVGNSGANRLEGGIGADTLIGGDGNDTYYVDNVGDVVIEAADEGNDVVQSSISYVLTDNVERLILTGAGNINGTGNNLNNGITGNTGDNTLMGYAGGDELDGGEGADVMIGGEGGDTYFVDNSGDIVIEEFGEGTDTVYSSISYALTDNVERLILTGTAHINATGNTLYNSIIGNSGNNTIDGGIGSDRMEGGDGNDTYFVDHEGDLVIESLGGGTDHVISSISYSLTTYIENLTLTGTDDLTGAGNNSVNIIIGNSGNNRLHGSGGADTLIGGLGNDTYTVDNVLDVIVEYADEGIDSVESSVSWTLATHFEHLRLSGTTSINGFGNDSDNTLEGNNGSNTLIGYAGNDYLDGGPAGVDTMIGGTGNDYYVVSHSYDVVIEEEGEGIDTVQTSVHWTLGATFENLVSSGGSGLTLIGNSANNTIIGSAGNNYIDGGAGVDTMSGGVANDTYFVDNVNDVVIEQAGTAAGTDDTVRSSVSYTLSENIELLTLTGTDDLNGTGNSGQNTITGTSGNNTLDGGSSYDRMIGGDGDDVYIVDNGGDVIVEQEGGGIDIVFSSVTYTQVGGVENMTLTGSANISGTGNSFANIIVGNSGNNVLNAVSGDDILFGGEGNDSLNGGLGNDTLYGGAGADTLTGSSNADIFVFDVDSYGSVDVVTDFSTGSGDAIDIRDLLDGYDSGTDDVTEWVRITTSGSNSIVEVDRDGVGLGYGWTQVATLNGVTGLTDEAALVTAGNLLVA